MSDKTPNLRISLCICLILLIVFGAFLPVLKNGFVNWDDDNYVVNNTSITSVSVPNLKSIFGSFFVGHYMPLTILSYLLNYQFFKLNPFGYHLTNLILHLLNCLLVFYLIYLLSRNIGVSFITAILFGIHPLHVESVAWVSERKDVLYSFFYLLSAITYLYYLTREHKSRYYLISLFLFLCSLLSKSMAVTLPLLLLLMDYYLKRKPNRGAILDKIPYFCLSFVFGIIAIFGVYLGNMVRSEAHSSLFSIISVASYGIVFYLGKLFLPIKLSCLYPYYNFEYNPTYLYSIIAVILLLLIMALSVKYTRKLLFGAAFFLITLLPALQFIPASTIIVADRYAYIPSIGVFFILSTLIYWLYSKKLKILALVVVIFIILNLSFLTYNRCKVWKDGISLWSDVLENYSTVIAYNSRGLMFVKKNDYKKAYDDFSEAIRVCYKERQIFDNQGDYSMNLLYVTVNLANMQYALGRKKEAIVTLNKLIKLNPDYSGSYLKLASIYYSMGENDKAIVLFKMAIEKDPNFAGAYYTLGTIYDGLGNKEEALKSYCQAVKINPRYLEAYNNLASIYAEKGQIDKAIGIWKRVIEINPDFTTAHFNLTKAYFYQKKYALAIFHCDKVLKSGSQVDPKLLELLKPHRK